MPCHPTLLTFLKRYENVPASLADAAWIRLAEINDAPLLLTTDRDFQIYGRCWMCCRRGEVVAGVPARQTRSSTSWLAETQAPVAS